MCVFVSLVVISSGNKPWSPELIINSTTGDLPFLMDDGIYLPFHADFSFTFPIQRYITDIATRHFFKRKKKNKKFNSGQRRTKRKKEKGKCLSRTSWWYAKSLLWISTVKVCHKLSGIITITRRSRSASCVTSADEIIFHPNLDKNLHLYATRKFSPFLKNFYLFYFLHVFTQGPLNLELRLTLSLFYQRHNSSTAVKLVSYSD